MLKKKLTEWWLRKAKVIRFYGLSLKEVNKMAGRNFERLYKAIAPIEAQEMIAQITVSTYPHAEKTNRQSVRRNLENLANPFRLKNANYITTNQLAELLRAKQAKDKDSN